MLTPEQQARLEATYLRLNPVKLRAEIQRESDMLWEFREKPGDERLQEARETRDGLEGGMKERLSASGKAG